MNSTKTKLSKSESANTKAEIPFHSLSPISDKKKHQYYCDALDWALRNSKKKDIKNVALTGTYGSGKSSILKTFQETTPNENLRFLNISLATFKEETDEKKETINKKITQKPPQNPGTNTNSPDENKEVYNGLKDQLRLIELSILQQIFYHEEYDNIPDSRFKKIRSLKPQQVKETSWLLFGFIFTFYTFFSFHSLRNLMNIPDPQPWFGYLVQGLLATIGLILSFFLLRHIVEFSQKITISKLNFQNLEIQVAEKLDKSILNNHLDEILYFFEVTDYNVVIIEDLDRFEQTEIFTKLREINLLINNSKSIDRTVTFIYAVRDEMFKDKERTKFFDFIIPVIPVINYSNSNEQLIKALEKFNYSISTELIDEVAFYIDDMRLLYNIVNEFHIYFQKFKGKKYQNKLFAMIVYKNIYPEDFALLGQNQGNLYKRLVEKKKEWVKEAVDKLEKENSELETELEELNQIFLKDLNELKRIYLFEYVKRVSNLSQFRIQNVNYSLDKMLDDVNFDKLRSSSINYTTAPYNHQSNFNFTFSDVEAEVDPDKTFLERKAEIENRSSGRIKEVRKELKSNEEEKRKIKNARIKYLLRDKKIALSAKPSRQDQLITLLVRNGYIAEDYLNYISYFYPGSITENDHWFLMNVRNESESEFDYELDQVENVIKKISESEFVKNYVLNYSLLDQFLESKKYSVKKDLFLKQLANESNDSVKFVYSYIKDGKNSALFIKTLCKCWIGIWHFIEQDNTLSEDEKSNYLALILNNAEIEDIEKIASNSQLEVVLNEKSDFLSIVNDSKRQIEIIAQFDLKFTSLKLDGSPEEIRKYIYSMNNYAINPYMLRIMIKEFGDYREDDFYESNYAAIKTSGCDSLIEYIENNIEKYINSVYLKLKDNSQEKQKYLIKLLNHPDIKKKSKENIILQSKTLTSNFSELEDPEQLSDFLIKNLKVEPTWENVIYYFQEKENSFSETLTTYINNSQIAEKLSKEPIPKEKQFFGFRSDFLLNNGIVDELYVSYLDTFPLPFKELSFDKLSVKKVAGLVDKHKISFNPENYNKLRSNFPPIHLKFIILNISEFFTLYSEIILSETELAEILEDHGLNDSQKIRLIEKFEAENAITDPKALTLIGKIALEYTRLKLSGSAISSVLLKSSLKSIEKIELFMNNLTALNSDFIPQFLNSLGSDYGQLNEKGPMPYFKKTDQLIKFFEHLKREGIISKIKDKKDQVQVTTFRK